MIGERVVVRYVRSLGATTDQDLTGPVRTALEGRLVTMEMGRPLVLELDGGYRWRTTLVQTIEAAENLAEVWTQRSVYRITRGRGRSRGGAAR